MAHLMVDRITKRLNAAHKRANHESNAAVRAQMNRDADKSEGRHPRPMSFVGKPGPYRYTIDGPKRA